MIKLKSITTRYLIIGNSAGGIGAAEAIRSVDPDNRIIIVSDEPFPAYSRPLISEYLSHERDLKSILFRAEDFYTRLKIDLLSGHRVAKIDTANRSVQLEDGLSVHWQKLLLATGGIPIIPSIKGLDKHGVFSFIKLEDAQKIDSYVPDIKNAVVIGGGLIGISVAEALTKRGINVTVIEMKDRILNTILDETASEMASNVIKSYGVKLITSNTVSEVQGNNRVEGIKLDNGEVIPCQMLIVAIGVLPRLDLIKDTGININRGIIIDRHMNTSQPDIFACGDVAEGYDFIADTDRLIPIWPNAYTGGRVAGLNMAGKQTTYVGGTAMNSINYFGMDIVSAGLISAPVDGGYEILVSHRNGNYKKLLLQKGQIYGMIFVNDIEKAGIIFGLMRDRINVESFKNALIKDDFGLIDLPFDLLKKYLGIITPDKHIVPIKEEIEQPIFDE